MPTLSSLRAAGSGRWWDVLRSQAVGWCWFIVTLWTSVVFWQLVVGWPLTRTLAFHPTTLEGRVWEGKFRPRVPLVEWNLPWARAWVQGRALPVYQSRKSLEEAPGEGCCIKTDRVLLRLPNLGQLAESPPGEVRVSWSPSWAVTMLSLAMGVLGTALLGWARHPWVLAANCSFRRVPWAVVLGVVVLAGAALLRWGAFAFPSWHPDSDEFLRPAADLAAGRSLSVTDRPLGYSLVVGAVLRVWEDLRAILWLHQGSSLVFAGALGLVLGACAERLFRPGWGRALARGTAVVAMAYWGWHERILQREWHLIPEALVPLYLALQVWLIWRLGTRRLSWHRGLLEFALLTVVGWVIYYTKPNWGLALGVLPLAWLVFCLGEAGSRPRFWRWTGAGALVYLGVSLAGLACQLLTPANTQASLEIRYRVLVCWHLDLVQPEIQRRLALQPLPPERALLEELAPLLEQERVLAARRGAGAYPSLGYDADRLYYEGYLGARLYWSRPQAERVAFCRGLFLGAVRRHPGQFCQYVWRQTTLLWPTPYGSPALYLPQYPRLLALGEKFAQRPQPYFSPLLLERYRATLQKARSTLEGPWPSAPRMALSLRLEPLSRVLCATFRWCLGLPLSLLAIVSLWRPWRRRVPWRRLLPVLGLATWALGSALASALTSSLAQALEIQRYIDLFMPVSLLAQVLWPSLAVAIVRSLCRAQPEGMVETAPVDSSATARG